MAEKLTKQEVHLTELLKAVKQVLDKHNIEFWLDCGTLLGAVRDKRFISWEYDIDLGAWDHKNSIKKRELLAEEIRDKGFKVWVAENYMNIKKEADFWLDINFYQIRDSNVIKPTLYPKNLIGKILCVLYPILLAPDHCPTVKIKSRTKHFVMKVLVNISRAMPFFFRKQIACVISIVYKKIGSKDVSWMVPINYFRNLLKIRFYGMEINVPSKTEEYLAYRYGKNWRTPREKWTTVKNDGAVIKFPT